MKKTYILAAVLAALEDRYLEAGDYGVEYAEISAENGDLKATICREAVVVGTTPTAGWDPDLGRDPGVPVWGPWYGLSFSTPLGSALWADGVVTASAWVTLVDHNDVKTLTSQLLTPEAAEKFAEAWRELSTLEGDEDGVLTLPLA